MEYKNIWYSKFEDKINAINDKYLQFFCENFPLKQDIILARDDYHEAILDYKKNFNHFLYWFIIIFGFFFSALLLFIPFYWTYTKFKDLKEDREDHLDEIEAAKDFLEQTKYEACCQLDLSQYISEVAGLVNYQDMGPVTNGLICALNSPLLQSYLVNTKTHNPSDTSWGVLDNKIIINSKRKMFKIVNQVYTGSKTIYIGSGDDRRSYVVNASITKPKPTFPEISEQFIFIDFTDALEFKFIKKYGAIGKGERDHQIPLENQEFEEHYDWYRTDETEFRMFFTPYAQEKFLQEDGADNNKKDLESNLQFYQIGNLLSSNYPYKVFNLADFKIDHLLINFCEVPDYMCDQTVKDIITYGKKRLWYFVHKLYANWFFPILAAANHKNIVNQALEPSFIYHESYPYYILKRSMGFTFPRRDTKSIQHCETTNSTYHNLTVFTTNISSLTFRVEQKVEDVYTSGTYVPVYYNEYIPLTSKYVMVFTIVQNPHNYFYKNMAIDYCKKIKMSEKLKVLIDELKSSFNIEISLSGNILAVLDKENSNNEETLKSFLYNIQSIIL